VYRSTFRCSSSTRRNDTLEPGGPKRCCLHHYYRDPLDGRVDPDAREKIPGHEANAGLVLGGAAGEVRTRTSCRATVGRRTTWRPSVPVSPVTMVVSI
jgi:hypothetical protein